LLSSLCIGFNVKPLFHSNFYINSEIGIGGKGENFSLLTSISSWGILIPYIQALISDSDFERLNNLIDQLFIQDIKDRDEKLARLAGKLIFLSLPVAEKQVKKDPEFLKYELELS
jgi:hypothetical protein